jgi:hypothetical protein
LKHLALIGFGLFLLTLTGAFGRVFHLEWVRPDPILVLDVFIAMYMEPTLGVLSVFILGIASDSFAGTPPGMLANCHLIVWVIMRWSKKLLMFKNRSAQLGLVWIVSLLFCMMVMANLVILKINTGAIWVCFKAMLPNSFINMLVAMIVWSVSDVFLPSDYNNQASIFMKKWNARSLKLHILE